MINIDGTPFVWLTFQEDGQMNNKIKALNALRDARINAQATDILIMAHGWKNEQQQALALYRRIWQHTRPYLNSSRKFVLVGIAWPSVAFPKDFDEQATISSGGASSVSAAPPPDDLDLESFRIILDEALPGDENARLRELAEQAADEKSSDASSAAKSAMAAEFVRVMRYLTSQADPELAEEGKQMATAVSEHPDILFHVTNEPFIPDSDAIGGAVGATGVGKIFDGPRATMARLASQFTYYPMKIRAGNVGHQLGAQLDPQSFLDGARIHLLGHSFGARLVAACALQMQARQLQSLILLQGAFSHNGLAEQSPGGRGYFADVVKGKRVRGPIVITHTHNDRACTFFYALASKLSGDGARAIGGRNDRFGSMGGNGALHVATVDYGSFPTGSSNKPVAGKVNNYLADKVIVKIPGGIDAHNNIGTTGMGALIGAALSA